jgi:hypothetical protein
MMLLSLSLQATSCPRDAATEYAEIATGEPCEEQVEQTTFVLVQPFERRHEQNVTTQLHCSLREVLSPLRQDI